MKVYSQDGIVSENESILYENNEFSIQCVATEATNTYFYPGDDLLQEINSKLINISDLFVDTYFPNRGVYAKEAASIPCGLFLGGQNSDIHINKDQFLKLVNQYIPCVTNLYRHIYVADCQYLVATIQHLLQSADYCFVQYYIQITRVNDLGRHLGEHLIVCSPETRQLAFYLETFFTKVYSVLDLLVKITYELENPVSHFSSITKLKSSEKIWGNRKELRMNKLQNTLFEDCVVVRQIEALRNESVHNGAWEFDPKVFLRFEGSTIVERYMLFPDFEEGHLSTVKNRKHFFSTELKVNEALVSIHEEFYHRLLATLRYIVKSNQHKSSDATI